MTDVKIKNEIDAAKENFLSLITHELRTPLTGIVGAASMIPEAGELNDKQREYLYHLTECTDQLMNVLNDILDLTEMKSGKLMLKTSSFNIRDCAKKSISVIKAKAEQKNLNVELRINNELPSLMMGDEMRLKQILVNLLSNSVKFTDRGCIILAIDAQIEKELDVVYNARTWRLWFSVRDTGIGIPIHDREKIFLMFEQGSTEKKYSSTGGIGIGLAIVKNLVNLMGGEIQIESEGIPGKGTCFSFNIALPQQPNLTSLIKNNIHLLNDAKILIVDDREEIRVRINDLLFKWGIIPTTVGSAAEALQYLRYRKFSETFSLVIIDIHMPYMSGVELAQRILKDSPCMPLIGLSSIGDVKEKNELFDFFLHKPIEEYTLFPCILECLKLNKINNSSKSKNVVTKKEKKKSECRILVAEDDDNNAYMIKELLISLGYSKRKIKIAANGEKCVEEAKKRRYDACLMDIRMPIMNGIEAAKHLKALENPPAIVAVSAGSTDECKDECSKVGMIAYVTKPIDKRELDEVLKKILGSN